MTPFLNMTFPLLYSAITEGGPRFSTRITSSGAGFEVRNAEWVYPLHSYRISIDALKLEYFDYLLSFFMVTRGRYFAFRFLDWNDYLLNSEIIGVHTSGNTTNYVLTKTYTFDGNTYTRRIYLPYISGVHTFPHATPGSFVKNASMFPPFTVAVAGNVLPYVSGSPTSNTWTEISPGVIRISSSYSGNVTISGSFAVPCRFDTDNLPVTRGNTNFVSINALPLVEVRL